MRPRTIAIWLCLALAGCGGGDDDPAVEDCGNGVDDDGDGDVDCDDSDCAAEASCQAEICDNGIDDDGDGDADCDDPACGPLPICQPGVEDCDNGGDDDEDGRTDCDDDDCNADPACGPTNNAGVPCTGDEQCTSVTGDDAFCLTEEIDQFTGGYCTELCEGDLDCGTNGRCVEAGVSLCADLCAGPTDCRPGYECLDVGGGTTVCWIVFEVCDNTVDDNADGDIDCDDPECVDDVACMVCGDGAVTGTETCDDGNATSGDGCSDACAFEPDFYCIDPVPATLGSQAGDTAASPTSNGFAGSCTGEGAPEFLYWFEPPGTGQLYATVTSDADLGVYVRDTCASEAAELGCIDFDFGDGVSETVMVDVQAGVGVTIFVDGFAAGEAGPYTLDLAFGVCGNGAIEAGERCDDGGVVPGDGCDASCRFEPSAICAEPATMFVGTNVGDTSDGTTIFEGSCTGLGAAREDVWEITPNASGTLTIVLTSAEDLGLYARSLCDDATPGAELGCVDAAGGGSAETLMVPVTVGVTITVIVDGFRPWTYGAYSMDVTIAP
jgi:cysteine-rich repeat protein